MPIDENMLFKTIYERHGDKPIEMVMEEVAKAKASYLKAEMALLNQAKDVTPKETIETEAIALPDGEAAKKKRYTKRSLQGRDPKKAIKEKTIMCCLCGDEKPSISTAHLKNVHQITPDDYRKLCGYDEKQQLACKELQKKRVAAIEKAKAKRAENLAAKKAAAE